jgi:ABC-type polysaccharide/polyol phosphate export permease
VATFERPVIEIRAEPGRLTVGALEEVWRYREVLLAFLIRHVKIRYKQALIGIGWAAVQPILSALLFALFFGKFVHVPSEGVPYVLFALAGMVAWTYFAGAVGSAMESLVMDQGLLRKVYFPRELLPLAAIGAGVVDFVPGLVTLAIVGAVLGVRPSIAWLAIPLAFFVLVVPSAALGLALAAFNVYYRDVRYALPYLLQLGLFASPVIYSLAAIPAPWRNIYAVANPVAAGVDGLRRIMVHGTWPDLALTIAALVWSTILLALAYVIFKVYERGFSDRV